ncbi:neuroglian-like [Penaeus chinensis]|uniref:neuroglian-like n=1 Tax=Penaeus chinensis TaxID=139456 RepID=UPI001FB8465B|nr:neuroglian-like [Penaeus chinensis]
MLYKTFLIKCSSEQCNLTKIIIHDSRNNEILRLSVALRTEYRMGNWVYLNVSYPEDDESTHPEASIAPVKQYLSPRQITVLEGEDVKLHCLYGGYPVPEIRWWRESRADVEDDQLEHFGKILVLQDVDREDTGSYYCQASNEAGESEAHQFTVYVEAAPEFIVEPEVVNLPEGETATLSCEAKGDPEPTITWTKNGQPMDTHETTLMFDRLSFADKTVIACNASNEHGYVYKSVYLNVLSLPPEWMTEPKDVYVLEGGSAELECEAFGSPDPEITWARRDGDEKTIIHDEDPRYEVNEHQLLINTVDDTTDGAYVCTATNKFASIESEAEVAMRSMTQVEVSIKDERVEAGDHVTLDCRVAIDPLLKSSVTWLKDNVEIDLKDDNFHLGQRAVDESNDDDDDDKHKIEKWVLEIEEVHGHDSGVYTCRVHTDLDDVTDDLILTVEDVPNPPSLTNVECNPRSAYLGWASTGDNNAKLQGFVIQYRTRLHPEWKDAKNQIPAAETSFTPANMVVICIPKDTGDFVSHVCLRGTRPHQSTRGTVPWVWLHAVISPSPATHTNPILVKSPGRRDIELIELHIQCETHSTTAVPADRFDTDEKAVDTILFNSLCMSRHIFLQDCDLSAIKS